MARQGRQFGRLPISAGQSDITEYWYGPARSRRGVDDLDLVAELDRVADAALADGAGVGIVQAHQPAGPCGHATGQAGAGLLQQPAGPLDGEPAAR